MNLEVIKNPQKALSENRGRLDCPKCNEDWYSPFDKLFILTYGECYDCTPEKELNTKSDNILMVLRII